MHHHDTGVAYLEARALRSRRSHSSKPKKKIRPAARKPLFLQYAELLRLRKAIQQASTAQSGSGGTKQPPVL
jgi:hypothetical protein